MESIIRGAAVYLILLVIMRISGRRTIAQATSFDFVLMLIVAETTQQALLGDDFSITNAALVIATLTVLDIGFSYVKRWSPAMDRLIDGTPTLLIHNGVIDHRVLKRSRTDVEDIMAAARLRHGIIEIAEVRHAILESDGGISIVPR
jgi:uncharacterized membrane protein YcaP (DUF421 family)